MTSGTRLLPNSFGFGGLSGGGCSSFEILASVFSRSSRSTSDKDGGGVDVDCNALLSSEENVDKEAEAENGGGIPLDVEAALLLFVSSAEVVVVLSLPDFEQGIEQ